MNYNSKIIIACDFEEEKELFSFLEKFNDKKLFLKLGMEFLYCNGFQVIKKLKKMGHNVFVDLKLLDIPNTCAKAIKSLSKYEPDFLTIHSLNSLEALKLMRKEADKNNIKLLGVTILTSLNENDLKELNFSNNISSQVEILVQRLKMANIYGVISSPHESNIVKKYNLTSVTPGIRLGNDDKNDQKRTSTPKEALSNGSDFLVIGRSITKSNNVLETYEKIEKEINQNEK